MLRKDFLQAEMEKLSQVLARIMGLKQENDFTGADDLINNSLENDFGLKWEDISKMPSQDFEQVLETKNFQAQKLDLLARFLFEKASPFEQTSQTEHTLEQVLAIFGLLEQKHRTQSLENLDKRKAIENFLNNNR